MGGPQVPEPQKDPRSVEAMSGWTQPAYVGRRGQMSADVSANAALGDFRHTQHERRPPEGLGREWSLLGDTTIQAVLRLGKRGHVILRHVLVSKVEVTLSSSLPLSPPTHHPPLLVSL